MPESGISAMQRRLWRLVAEAQKARQIHLTDAARREWDGVYPELSSETPGLIGAIVNRAEAQTMRLALVYALLDGKQVIDKQHITAALALWRYANASAACLFGDRITDPTEQKILAILKAGPCTATALNRALSGHVTSDKLQRILGGMEAANRISINQEKTGGRPSKIIALRETSAYSGNSGAS